MATPDEVLPSIAAELRALRARVDYIDQRSQLARPLRVDAAQDSLTNAGVPQAWTIRKTVQGVCPVGYNACLVRAGVSAMATNSRAVGDYLYVMANIDGWDAGATYSVIIPPGTSGSVVSLPPDLVKTGLTPGQVITVSCKTATGGGAWAANASDQFGVSGTFYWYRR